LSNRVDCSRETLERRTALGLIAITMLRIDVRRRLPLGRAVEN
jgi:hypothetical protein